MITLETLCVRVGRVDPGMVRGWIGDGWIRPALMPETVGVSGYRFDAVDEARARLIAELLFDLDLDSGAVPVVLSLMDQLYDTRRLVRRMEEVLEDRENLSAEKLRTLLRERLARISAP